jgi:hypothetical protein
MTIQPFPLVWPDGLPRSEKRASSQFRSTITSALNNVRKSLEMFGADSGKPVTEIVLSSNVGGLSLEGPKDPGVAAWFVWDGGQRCIAVDRYPKPEDNLQAIHHILEARRTEMRHGGLHIVRQTFKGFTALPAPPGQRPWREVLKLPAGPLTRAQVDAAYRERAASAHPDKGGSTEAMTELNRARDEGRRAVDG